MENIIGKLKNSFSKGNGSKEVKKSRNYSKLKLPSKEITYEELISECSTRSKNISFKKNNF